MRIKMLETKCGSPDGHIVNLYPKGAELLIPHNLATSFIRNGWATPLESFDFNEWFEGFLKEIRK